MSRIILMSLFSFIAGCFSSSENNTPDLAPLSSVQTAEIKEWAISGRSLLVKYIGDKTSYDENDIDQAVINWRYSHDQEKESPEYIITALGAFLGEYLISDNDLMWCTYTDNKGSDFCITHHKIVVQTFPHSTLYKAVVEEREFAIKDVSKVLFEQIEAHINDPEVQSH